MFLFSDVTRNCQVGLGRSTTGTVITSLVLNWLRRKQSSAVPNIEGERQSTKVNYQTIHSLLRVIKDGLECKRVVDLTIDRCAAVMNLRDAIERSRIEAESCIDDPIKQKRIIEKGILHLKRYFLLRCGSIDIKSCIL